MGYALYFLEKKTVFTGQSRQLNVAVISRSVSQSAIKTESRDKVPAYRQAFDRQIRRQFEGRPYGSH